MSITKSIAAISSLKSLMRFAIFVGLLQASTPKNLIDWSNANLYESASNTLRLFVNSTSMYEITRLDAIKDTENVNLSELGLRITKKPEAKVSFMDGIYFEFAGTPKYLSLDFSSSNLLSEDMNLRIYLKTAEDTIINFRCGYNGLLRVNYEQIVDFYNKTLTDKSTTKLETVKWRTARFTFDWKKRTIRYFYNDENDSVEVQFYDLEEGATTELSTPKVDHLMLYNLQPGTTSFIKNLVLSDAIPADFSFSGLLRTLSMLLIGFQLFFVLM